MAGARWIAQIVQNTICCSRAENVLRGGVSGFLHAIQTRRNRNKKIQSNKNLQAKNTSTFYRDDEIKMDSFRYTVRANLEAAQKFVTASIEIRVRVKIDPVSRAQTDRDGPVVNQERAATDKVAYCLACCSFSLSLFFLFRLTLIALQCVCLFYIYLYSILFCCSNRVKKCCRVG